MDINELVRYSRYGTVNDIWPIIYGTLNNRLSEWKMHNKIKEQTVYKYSISMVDKLLVMFFDIGFERWGMIMNNKYPHPRIIDFLKDQYSDDIHFLWYSPESLIKRDKERI